MPPPPEESTQARYAYLDAASSEPLHPAARNVLLAALERGYADPRRQHGPGRDARLLLDNARDVVAAIFGLRADEVTFTSSGTEAVRRALGGLLAAQARRTGSPARLAHSAVEHSSVLHLAAAHPGPVTVLPVDATGRVTGGATYDVLALQSANHEVGTVQPVEAWAAAHPERPVFVDACASAGRLPLPQGWSALAASAHKWGGPAGVGVLAVRAAARWRQPDPEDDRAHPRAVGFENVAGALAAAAALQAVDAEREEVAARQRTLVDRLRTEIPRVVPDVEVVGDPHDRLPHLVTFSCLYADGESLVRLLDQQGFAVASGSACTTSTLEPSHVLAAMGALTHGNVRVSLTRETSEADVERFLSVLPGVVAEVRRAVGR